MSSNHRQLHGDPWWRHWDQREPHRDSSHKSSADGHSDSPQRQSSRDWDRRRAASSSCWDAAENKRPRRSDDHKSDPRYQREPQKTSYRHPADTQTPYRHSADSQTPYRHPEEPQTSYRHSADSQTPHRHPEEPQTSYRHSADSQTHYRHPEEPQTSSRHSADSQTPYRHSKEPQSSYRHTADTQTSYRHPADTQTSYRHPEEPQTSYRHPADFQTPYRHSEEPQTSYRHPADSQTPYRHSADTHLTRDFRSREMHHNSRPRYRLHESENKRRHNGAPPRRSSASSREGGGHQRSPDRSQERQAKIPVKPRKPPDSPARSTYQQDWDPAAPLQQNGSSLQLHGGETSAQSKGFQRFLEVLNQGVNVDTLTKIVIQSAPQPASGRDPGSPDRPRTPRHMTPADQRMPPGHWSLSPKGGLGSEEEVGLQEAVEQENKCRQMQDVLQAIGLDLGFEELGQMSHRIQERLYGRKDGDPGRRVSRESSSRPANSPRRRSGSSSSRSSFTQFPREYGAQTDAPEGQEIEQGEYWLGSGSQQGQCQLQMDSGSQQGQYQRQMDSGSHESQYQLQMDSGSHEGHHQLDSGSQQGQYRLDPGSQQDQYQLQMDSGSQQSQYQLQTDSVSQRGQYRLDSGSHQGEICGTGFSFRCAPSVPPPAPVMPPYPPAVCSPLLYPTLTVPPPPVLPPFFSVPASPAHPDCSLTNGTLLSATQRAKAAQRQRCLQVIQTKPG